MDLSVKYYLKRTEKFSFAPLLGINYDKYDFYALSGNQLNYIPGIGAVLLPGDNQKYYLQTTFHKSIYWNKNSLCSKFKLGDGLELKWRILGKSKGSRQTFGKRKYGDYRKI